MLSQKKQINRRVCRYKYRSDVQTEMNKVVQNENHARDDGSFNDRCQDIKTECDVLDEHI